jgi:hypothetical protein
MPFQALGESCAELTFHIHGACHLAMPGTAHQLFLAALIVASKFSNDIRPRNKSWIHPSAGLYEIDEVNLMERQFLFLLDFELTFDEEEAISHFQPVPELLGADLKDIGSNNKAKKEYNIKATPPPLKRTVISSSAVHSDNSAAQVVRRAVVDDERERLEVREKALCRVTGGSIARMLAAASSVFVETSSLCRGSSTCSCCTSTFNFDSQASCRLWTSDHPPATVYLPAASQSPILHATLVLVLILHPISIDCR